MVDLKEFVIAWEAASSVAEVAKKFNITRETAGVKASNLRKKGVKLKKMGVAGSAVDINGLNTLIGK